MFGVFIDIAGILAGTVLGLLLGKKLDEQLKKMITNALGLGVICVGILDLIKTENSMILMLSLIFGGVYGAMIGIDRNLNRFGKFLSQKIDSHRAATKGYIADGKYQVGESVVNAAILYSIGAMVIYGSIKAGMGDYSTMYIKTALDAFTALIFTVNGGFAVLFAAVPTLIIETALCLAASYLQPYITTAVINELSGIGGALMISIGIGMLGIKKIPTADFIPAIFGAFLLLL